MTKELAMMLQRSAEEWAHEYSKSEGDTYKWQAVWAYNNARKAWLELAEQDYKDQA